MSMIGNYLAISELELQALLENPQSIVEILYEKYSADVVDIEKSWHGIHFLLTGEQYGGEPPLANVVFGMVPIGEEDVGYGPALGTSAAAVTAISQALCAISEAEFRNKFDAAALNHAGIYPQIWDEGQEAMDYIAENFLTLQTFYKSASACGKAVITFIN